MIRTHIYIYNTIHYAYAYNYAQYVLCEKGDREHLLRATLRLAKYPTSTTYCTNMPCLLMSRGKPPALIISLAQAR